ncbi:MAG: DUF3307 domain-containing protein [Chitinophagaceae bacterium]|nr:DUF3307 domain-containing protein [Chitinophagaceae bacterium]
MNLALTWLVKLFLSHLLADFVLQPKRWVEDRQKRHFASPALYLHGSIAAILSWIFMGWQYWYFSMVILITHILIDGWKSYRPAKVIWFLADQALHLAIILGCYFFAFYQWQDLVTLAGEIGRDRSFWIIITAFLFLSFPSGIAIDQMTRKWREELPDAIGLANAGKWIGILERTLILIFLLQNQYAAIGLLITSKGLLRFSEKEKQEQKTEYVLIGSLISVCFSIVTGILVNYLIRL